MKSLEMFDIQSWEEQISENIQKQAIEALENGKVLYFPSLPFSLSGDEQRFLNPDILDPKSKNISFDIKNDRLAGTLFTDENAGKLKGMLKRFALMSRRFLDGLLPHYSPNLIQSKTSFRPVEIQGRKTSYRKDDTLLHVDSFPSNPTKGRRILRVFSNINPEGKPRVWRVGEPFEDVVKKMAPRASQPIFGVSHALKILGITKDYRTPYDHFMLQLHDIMKGDRNYQRHVPQEEIHFPAGSSWMVYTDLVSHAAMSGQHVLEQTFFLPVNASKNESATPLRILEKHFHKALV